jgi:uncharacterized OsmC-like protein
MSQLRQGPVLPVCYRDHRITTVDSGKGGNTMSTATAKRETRINGLAVNAMQKLSEAIASKRSAAAVEFKTRTIWLDGGHTRSIIKAYRMSGAEQGDRSMPFVVETDLPLSLAGRDRAVSPMEQLLVALNSCLTTTIVARAATRKIHLDALEVLSRVSTDLSGLLGIDGGYSAGTAGIHVEIFMESDCDANALDCLVSEAIASSPVHWLIHSVVPVRCQWNGFVPR